MSSKNLHVRWLPHGTVPWVVEAETSSKVGALAGDFMGFHSV